MRRALVLVILAACGGGGDFSVSVLTPCPSCGPGHVRAAATTDSSVTFTAEPTGVLAFGGQELKWLGPDLSVTGTASTDASGDYLSGPSIAQAVSGADGHGFALVTGENNDTGTTAYLYAFDASGHTIWTQTLVTDYAPPPLFLAIASDGSAIVAADTSNGYPATLGGLVYQGWIAIVRLDAATGANLGARMFSSAGTSLTSLSTTPDGGVLIAGTLSGHLDLGGEVGDMISRSTGKTVFMARLDQHFDGLWAKQYVATGNAPYADSVVADDQHVYMAGSYSKAVDLGDGITMTTSAVYANYIISYDAAGDYEWSTSTTGDLGPASLAPTPAGVLVCAGYLDALSIGGQAVPPSTTNESGICAELIGGVAPWVLATTGGGNHTCTAIGSSGGRAYVQIEAVNDTTDDHTQTTFDSITSSGQEKILLELATMPAP